MHFIPYRKSLATNVQEDRSLFYMNPEVLFFGTLVFVVVLDYSPLYAVKRDASTTLLFYTRSQSNIMHRLIALCRFA